MKKVIFILLITHSSLLIVNAQWQPDVRLTNNPYGSLTSFKWCIATSGDVVHVVWEGRDSNPEIYYKRSTDWGVNWGANIRLTYNSSFSFQPSIAVSGQTVHVVWYDFRDVNWEIYYKRSTDGGVSWGQDTRLTDNPALSEDPSVSVSGSVVHVVWKDNRQNSEIYYKRSTDAGTSWGQDTRLTNDTNGSQFPSVSVFGLIVHVVWYDYRNVNGEIYYKRSTDEGVNWGADARLTNNPSFSVYPSIAVSGQAVHVVWYDYRDGNDEIYYKRSTDLGMSWGVDTRLTSNSDYSHGPSIAVSSQAVHVVWYDGRDEPFGNDEIYYKRSTDGGASWEADARLTNNPSYSQHPSIAVSGQVVHVVWYDGRDGHTEIYYKRDPTGNPVGIKNISSEIPKGFSLLQNYPNPFNPNTKIRFQIPKSGFVNMVVYDILGREIATLVNENLNPGTYEAEWDGSNQPSGVYYYKLIAGDYSETKKMVLIK